MRLSFRCAAALVLAGAILLPLGAMAGPTARAAAPKEPSGWAVGERYLTLDGRPVFLMGANYITSGWLGSLEDWDATTIDADLQALREIGANSLRWFPLWPLIQPEPDTVVPEKLARIDELVSLAESHGLHLQISTLNGWMSGLAFLPPWAEGAIFTDPGIVAGEHLLARAIASRYRGRTGVSSYDFGNELNVLVSLMKLEVTPEQIERWMEGTYRVYKEADPMHPVTNGVGTGFDERFDIRSIGRTSDFLSTHSYPFFHGTHRLDPTVGLRTTYSVNYSVAWAAMEGRPVLMQETGHSTAGTSEEDVRSYLRVTALSSWADGAAGYLWWSSHAIDPDYRIPSEWYSQEFSLPSRKAGDLDRYESAMGLLDRANRPRAAGLEFARVAGWIEELGLGWEEKRPVVYVLVPETHEFARTMLQLITPFTLAKRAHAQVLLLYEERDVPADAAAVIIPGFALSAAGRAAVGRYLDAGGVVYQSWEKDFGEAIHLAGPGRGPEAVRGRMVDGMPGGSSGGQELELPAIRVRTIEAGEGVEVLALLQAGAQAEIQETEGEPLLCRTSVGRGTYYYLGAAPEAALETLFDPWDVDETHRLYEAFLPAVPLRLDNPAIELFHKTRGSEEIAILINHTNRVQAGTLRSDAPLRLRGLFEDRPERQGQAFDVALGPGGVRVLRLERDAAP